MHAAAPNHWKSRLVAAMPMSLAVLALVAFGVVPRPLIEKFRLLDYGVCAQLPGHMLMPGGVELPLCARNTGIYTGVLLGFVLLVAAGRSRRARQAHAGVVGVLLALIAVMAIDGANSVLLDFGFPHLYQPTNVLRLCTGMGAGMALAALVTPIVTRTLSRSPQAIPVLTSQRELCLYLTTGAAACVVILTQWPPLLYPVALFSTTGMLLLLSTLNVVGLVMVSRAEGTINRAAALLILYSAGFCLALVELLGLAATKSLMLGGLR